MIDAVDVLGDSSGSDVPVVVFNLVEIDEGDRDVPVFAFGGVGCGLANFHLASSHTK